MSLSRALRLKDLSAAHAAIMGRPATLDSRIAALAGVQPIITSDLTTGQAWLRGAPYALTSLPGWSFSRALAAYGETSGGVLVPFASGAPRLVNGRGQLIEGARTNLCLRSQEFDNASWTTSNGTLTPDAAVAPDGTTTADKLVGTAASTQGRVSQNIAGSIGATYTWSCYASSAGGTLVRIYADDNSTNTASVTYNTITGAVSTAAVIGGGNWTAVSSSAQQLGGGWWRFTLTFTATAVAPARFQVWHRDTSDGTNGIYIWGAQLEAAAFPSSYIPTAGSSVTRPADIPLIDISAYSPAIGAPYTMYANVEPSAIVSGGQVWLGMSDGTSSNGSAIYNSAGSPVVLNKTSGANDAIVVPGGTVSAGVASKLAARFETNNVNGAYNGTLGTADTSCTVSARSRVELGWAGVNNLPLFGYLSEFAIIPGAVSDANLQRLAAA